MEAKGIIMKWGISMDVLASKINMPLDEFEKKFKYKIGSSHSFTKVEYGLLRSALIELRNELEDVPEIDWNSAMKVIAKRKNNT